MCGADARADEEVGSDVLEEPGLQPDSLPDDYPHRTLLWHHVPAERPSPHLW